MKIILVRHGESVFNSESRCQGHSDCALSELGRRQAEKAAEQLKDFDISAVYSSDLSRARDTAEAIAGYHGLPVNADPDLRERAFGDWEGLTAAEISEAYPELYENYRRDSITNRPPKGERVQELQERVVRSINQIADRHADDTVVIVAHAGPIRAFFCHALGTDFAAYRRLSLDNAGATTFSMEANSWFLQCFNDCNYLRDLEPEGGHYED